MSINRREYPESFIKNTAILSSLAAAGVYFSTRYNRTLGHGLYNKITETKDAAKRVMANKEKWQPLFEDTFEEYAKRMGISSTATEDLAPLTDPDTWGTTIKSDLDRDLVESKMQGKLVSIEEELIRRADETGKHYTQLTDNLSNRLSKIEKLYPGIEEAIQGTEFGTRIQDIIWRHEGYEVVLSDGSKTSRVFLPDYNMGYIGDGVKGSYKYMPVYDILPSDKAKIAIQGTKFNAAHVADNAIFVRSFGDSVMETLKQTLKQGPFIADGKASPMEQLRGKIETAIRKYKGDGVGADLSLRTAGMTLSASKLMDHIDPNDVNQRWEFLRQLQGKTVHIIEKDQIRHTNYTTSTAMSSEQAAALKYKFRATGTENMFPTLDQHKQSTLRADYAPGLPGVYTRESVAINHGMINEHVLNHQFVDSGLPKFDRQAAGGITSTMYTFHGGPGISGGGAIMLSRNKGANLSKFNSVHREPYELYAPLRDDGTRVTHQNTIELMKDIEIGKEVKKGQVLGFDRQTGKQIVAKHGGRVSSVSPPHKGYLRVVVESVRPTAVGDKLSLVKTMTSEIMDHDRFSNIHNFHGPNKTAYGPAGDLIISLEDSIRPDVVIDGSEFTKMKGGPLGLGIYHKTLSDLASIERERLVTSAAAYGGYVTEDQRNKHLKSFRSKLAGITKSAFDVDIDDIIKEIHISEEGRIGIVIKDPSPGQERGVSRFKGFIEIEDAIIKASRGNYSKLARLSDKIQNTIYEAGYNDYKVAVEISDTVLADSVDKYKRLPTFAYQLINGQKQLATVSANAPLYNHISSIGQYTKVASNLRSISGYLGGAKITYAMIERLNQMGLRHQAEYYIGLGEYLTPYIMDKYRSGMEGLTAGTKKQIAARSRSKYVTLSELAKDDLLTKIAGSKEERIAASLFYTTKKTVEEMLDQNFLQTDAEFNQLLSSGGEYIPVSQQYHGVGANSPIVVDADVHRKLQKLVNMDDALDVYLELPFEVEIPEGTGKTKFVRISKLLNDDTFELMKRLDSTGVPKPTQAYGEFVTGNMHWSKTFEFVANMADIEKRKQVTKDDAELRRKLEVETQTEVMAYRNYMKQTFTGKDGYQAKTMGGYRAPLSMMTNPRYAELEMGIVKNYQTRLPTDRIFMSKDSIVRTITGNNLRGYQHAESILKKAEKIEERLKTRLSRFTSDIDLLKGKTSVPMLGTELSSTVLEDISFKSSTILKALDTDYPATNMRNNKDIVHKFIDYTKRFDDTILEYDSTISAQNKAAGLSDPYRLTPEHMREVRNTLYQSVTERSKITKKLNVIPKKTLIERIERIDRAFSKVHEMESIIKDKIKSSIENVKGRKRVELARFATAAIHRIDNNTLILHANLQGQPTTGGYSQIPMRIAIDESASLFDEGTYKKLLRTDAAEARAYYDRHVTYSSGHVAVPKMILEAIWRDADKDYIGVIIHSIFELDNLAKGLNLKLDLGELLNIDLKKIGSQNLTDETIANMAYTRAVLNQTGELRPVSVAGRHVLAGAEIHNLTELIETTKLSQWVADQIGYDENLMKYKRKLNIVGEEDKLLHSRYIKLIDQIGKTIGEEWRGKGVLNKIEIISHMKPEYPGQLSEMKAREANKFIRKYDYAETNKYSVLNKTEARLIDSVVQASKEEFQSFMRRSDELGIVADRTKRTTPKAYGLGESLAKAIPYLNIDSTTDMRRFTEFVQLFSDKLVAQTVINAKSGSIYALSYFDEAFTKLAKVPHGNTSNEFYSKLLMDGALPDLLPSETQEIQRLMGLSKKEITTERYTEYIQFKEEFAHVHKQISDEAFDMISDRSATIKDESRLKRMYSERIESKMKSLKGLSKHGFTKGKNMLELAQIMGLGEPEMFRRDIINFAFTSASDKLKNLNKTLDLNRSLFDMFNPTEIRNYTKEFVRTLSLETKRLGNLPGRTPEDRAYRTVSQKNTVSYDSIQDIVDKLHGRSGIDSSIFLEDSFRTEMSARFVMRMKALTDGLTGEEAVFKKYNMNLRSSSYELLKSAEEAARRSDIQRQLAEQATTMRPKPALSTFLESGNKLALTQADDTLLRRANRGRVTSILSGLFMGTVAAQTINYMRSGYAIPDLKYTEGKGGQFYKDKGSFLGKEMEYGLNPQPPRVVSFYGEDDIISRGRDWDIQKERGLAFANSFQSKGYEPSFKGVII